MKLGGHSMRLLAVLLVAGSVLAQSSSTGSGFGRIVFPGGSGPGPGSVSNTGVGRIVFPGTGAPAVVRPGTSPGPVFPILTGPNVPHQIHSNRSVVPIPVFYGGGYYNYDPPPAQPMIVPVAAQPPYYGPQPYYPPPSSQEQPPVVIINQYFRDGGPVEPEPQPTAAAPAPAPQAQQDDLRNVFLIAMKDYTIYAASAYWVEENTLNYITIQGSQNSASLDLVDRELSQRLNRDRKVAFGLPGN